ncbi:MAG: glycosyltransferase family 4 protein, partial [Cyanobacteria bacterium J06554_6]
CDLSVFSSAKEGVPNGILEPMAAGKAIVASKITGNRQALGEQYKYFFEVLRTSPPEVQNGLSRHVFSESH